MDCPPIQDNFPSAKAGYSPYLLVVAWIALLFKTISLLPRQDIVLTYW